MKTLSRIFCLILIALLFSSVEVEAKRITLPRNRIDGECVLTQSMFNRKADEYIIRHRYNLRGGTITIPEDAKIVFKGSGCLTHGTIIGQESSVKASSEKTIFNDIIVLGRWNVEHIYSKWFDFGLEAVVNTRNFQNMCSLTSDGYLGVLFISKGDYAVEVNNDIFSCLRPNSNTIILLEGNLLLQPNSLGTYNIIEISNKYNVSISGSGCIVGDVISHTGTEGEWGMGVNITSSRDVSIQNITIKNCWGDCIYLGQSKISKEEFSENVRIEQVTCDSGRRQGLSLIAGKNIHIVDCHFINTGSIRYTAPGRGIDIEPNDKDNTIVQNILIEDCQFSGNYNDNDFLTYNLNQKSSVRVIRCKMDGRLSLYQNSYNVVIDSCEVNSLDFVDSAISDNVVKNTIFKSLKPNTQEPRKVSFDKCEYPNKETSSLMNIFGLPTVLLTGFCIGCLFLKKNNRT
jgi:hypothetical protein